MAFGVNLCSAMLQASGAHLRCDPRGRISHDAKEAPMPPRNARIAEELSWMPTPPPARTTSDRPSSSRSGGPPYYARPSAGSAGWGPPHTPTRLPEAQVASLLPSSASGYLPGSPGVISPEDETRCDIVYLLFFLLSRSFSPIAVGHTI